MKKAKQQRMHEKERLKKKQAWISAGLSEKYQNMNTAEARKNWEKNPGGSASWLKLRMKMLK